MTQDTRISPRTQRELLEIVDTLDEVLGRLLTLGRTREAAQIECASNFLEKAALENAPATLTRAPLATPTHEGWRGGPTIHDRCAEIVSSLTATLKTPFQERKPPMQPPARSSNVVPFPHKTPVTVPVTMGDEPFYMGDRVRIKGSAEEGTIVDGTPSFGLQKRWYYRVLLKTGPCAGIVRGVYGEMLESLDQTPQPPEAA